MSDRVILYTGQIWYDLQGLPVYETGHAVPGLAAARIKEAEKNLIGKWNFSVVKVKLQAGSSIEWASSVIFPDGKDRKLVAGEIAVAYRSKGTWLTMAMLEKSMARVQGVERRAVPDIRFPWKGSAVNCRLEKFPNLVTFEAWLVEQIRPGMTISLCTPSPQTQPPDEAALFCYIAFVE
jgi:hypothetical protein